jgi:hypothetical protein
MCFFSQSGLFLLKIHNSNKIPNCNAFYLLIIHFREKTTSMCSILCILPPNCNLVFNMGEPFPRIESSRAKKNLTIKFS